MKNIENNKESIVSEIKEKIKKNRKYTHPCNKEFQEDIKIYGFNNGYDYINWMQNNGILRNPSDIDKKENTEKKIRNAGCSNITEYKNFNALKLGYKDWNEQQREERYDKGISNPSAENKDCSLNFGIDIGEKIFNKILLEIFEYVRHDKMMCRDGGIDFFVKDPGQEFINKYPQFKLERNKEYKIQLKMRCLYVHKKWISWNFAIQYNNKVDFFILSGWNNRIDLDHMYTWLIHKDEIIRGRKLWRRDSLSILNRPEKLLGFTKFELTDKIEKLQDICKKRC